MISDISHLVWRPMVIADSAAWADMFNAIATEDKREERYTTENAAVEFKNPHLDPKHSLISVFDGDVMVGYAYAQPRPMSDVLHRVMLAGGVRPEYRRKGIGARLLTIGIANARVLHERHRPHLPMTVDVRADVTNVGAVAAYEGAGMKPIRWYPHMVHTLGDAVPDLRVPEGLAIEHLTTENDAEFLSIRNETYVDRFGAVAQSEALWRSLTDRLSTRRDLCFLLRDEASGEPVGFSLAAFWEAEAEASGVRDLYLLGIGTRRDHRGRGVGSALIAHTLRIAQQAGFDQVSLDTDSDTPDGGQRMYEKAGFTTPRSDVRYSLEG